MTEKKQKPLLEWMDHGDPDLVPVLMADAISTTASYYGVPVRKKGTSASFTGKEQSPITPDRVVRCHQETGIHFHKSLGCITPFDIIDFMPGIEMIVKEESDSDSTIKKITTLRTPSGEMSELFITPADRPGYWQEHLVKTEADLDAFASLVETNARTLCESPAAREKILARLKSEADQWPDYVPLYLTIGVPAFSLTCNLYMATQTAFYLLADHPEFMERLFEAETLANTVVVECAARAGADFVLGAINGLEIFSPAIYQNYFVPQARHLHETAHRHGMRGWVHTCGHMNKLIDMGVYEPMAVDVLESLSHPPLGDVTDLNAARKKLGNKIVTRGGVNVGLFYETDLTKVRERTREVLKEVRGFRHMIGDTNHPFPPYRRDNILAMAEEVRKTGRMFIF